MAIGISLLRLRPTPAIKRSFLRHFHSSLFHQIAAASALLDPPHRCLSRVAFRHRHLNADRLLCYAQEQKPARPPWAQPRNPFG